MRILLYGKSGQLGYELQQCLSGLGELIALDRNSYNDKPYLRGDLQNPAEIYLTIQSLKPDVVVNAAAYTAVDQAESNFKLADIVNHQAVAAMANACKQVKAILVHYSTDYVFNGTCNTPWTEQDYPAPLNQYGISKQAGEQAILKSGCHSFILRTAWLYGIHGNNFIKNILSFARHREVIRVVNDQFGTPTSATLVAMVTVKILQTYFKHNNPKQLEGIYHLTALGQVSWYDYTKFIIQQAHRLGISLGVKEIIPISSHDYSAQAIRPAYSLLDTAKIQQTFNLALPPWQLGVIQLIREILSYE